MKTPQIFILGFDFPVVMRAIKKIRNWALIGALSLGIFSSGSVYAADIFNGTRGPTNWQLDTRITYAKNENGVETIANNLILKYWDGENLGKWGFINLRCKSTYPSNESRNEIGKISIGMGPRGKIDNLYLTSYGALTSSIGNTDKGISLGSGQSDIKLGLLATYLISDKKYSVDGSLEYNFTGKDNKGINLPNQISAGLLGGGKVTDKIRLSTGLEGLIKEDGGYLLNSRTVCKYTASQSLCFELVGDAGIDAKKIPKKNRVTFLTRYNF